MYSTLGQNSFSQNRMATIVPLKSPATHSRQYNSPSALLCSMAETKAKVKAIMELMHQCEEGAYLRAVWTKTTMNMQPESSLSMNVVLGLEIWRMKNTRMNDPNIQLATTRRQDTASCQAGINGPTLTSSVSQQYMIAIRAPKNWASQQTGNILSLNLSSFLMTLQRVTAGLRLAPLTGPLKITPVSTPTPIQMSAHQACFAERAKPRNRVMPMNSKKNILSLGQLLRWLYFSCANVSSTDCFRELV